MEDAELSGAAHSQKPEGESSFWVSYGGKGWVYLEGKHLRVRLGWGIWNHLYRTCLSRASWCWPTFPATQVSMTPHFPSLQWGEGELKTGAEKGSWEEAKGFHQLTSVSLLGKVESLLKPVSGPEKWIVPADREDWWAVNSFIVRFRLMTVPSEGLHSFEKPATGGLGEWGRASP